jgi:hypothetical protein
MTYGPGLHRTPMAEYIADCCEVPSLSSGCAFRLVTDSPMHAYWSHPRLGGRVREDSTVADVGSIAHDILLGGEGKICEVDADDWRTKAAKEQRDTARANGLIPILVKQMGTIRSMAKAAREFIAESEIAGVFSSGESELTVIAQEGDTWLRARPDWLNLADGIHLSFKTSRASVSPDRFPRLMDAMGYGFAQEFYRRVLKSNGHDVRHVILAQSQDYPWACSLFELSPAKAAIESNQVDRAVKLWQECLKSGKWPGYGGKVHRVEPTPWAMAAEEERLMQEEMEAM